jgi:hypothetical protein
MVSEGHPTGVLNIEPAAPTPLRWSEVPITFFHEDQWTSFSELGRFPLVLKPVVAGSRVNKVLIDSGRGLNVLFTKTLKKMKLDITDMLTKCRMDLPGPTTSVGTRTDYSVGPWDYPACATRYLKAWSTRTAQE